MGLDDGDADELALLLRELSPPPVSPHTHQFTHTHIHIHTHKHLYIHIPSRASAHSNIPSRKCTHKHKHTCLHTIACTHHAHLYTQPPPGTYTHKCIFTHTSTLTLAHTHREIYPAPPHTHAHISISLYSHTCAYGCISCACCGMCMFASDCLIICSSYSLRVCYVCMCVWGVCVVWFRRLYV